MAFEKIFLLWQQSWYALIRTPITMWFGLIFLHLQRFYYALLTTYSFLAYACYIVAAYFFRNSLVGVCATLLMLSLIVYLMRPTVGLKKLCYLRHYCTLENITSVFALVFVYGLLASLLPKITLGLILLAALCSFSFVYDAVGSIPDKVGYTLVRTAYCMLYKAPVVFIFSLIAIINYINLGFVGIVFKILVFHPFVAALVMILYVSALHDNYELYYAE